MLEMWTIDLGDELFLLEDERKWEMASWVVRIGWVRLMSRMA